MLFIALWAVTLVTIPYGLFRKKDNLVAVSVLLFLYLSIPVMALIQIPNPDWVQVIRVTAP